MIDLSTDGENFLRDNIGYGDISFIFYQKTAFGQNLVTSSKTTNFDAYGQAYRLRFC